MVLTPEEEVSDALLSRYSGRNLKAAGFVLVLELTWEDVTHRK